MELRRPRPLIVALAAAMLALAAGGGTALAPPAAAATPKLERPASDAVAPAGYRLSADEAVRIAARGEKITAERPRHRRFAPTAYTRGPGRWQVSWFNSKGEQVAQSRVDDDLGALLEEWTGDQVAWTMARGYEGAFGRKLNAPYVWIPLCLLFLAPFVDPRRPFRLVHLDLLVLLAFGASHVFFNRGEIGISVPLVYPVLLYLLGRLLWAGFKPRERPEKLLPIVPASWVVVALVFLVAFRVGLNVVDSNVIDVGYAGVIGADRIADGDPLYGDGFSERVEHGDTYGPLTYLLYLPFEQALPWSGEWDGLPAAHGAALLFDLGTLLGLVALGRRLRRGREGRELGIALGYAWASFPYAAFALQTNANDGLVALCTVLAMLALVSFGGRPRAAAGARGAAVALGAAAKFAPLVLAPVFARGIGHRSAAARPAALAAFAAALTVVLAITVLPFDPDGGPRELYDRTVGYQASRGSPFSVWGQVPSLEWLQSAVKGLGLVLAAALFFVPRTRTPVQVAALGAAVLIAIQLGVSHWFYLYVAWFAPLALVALLAPLRGPPAPGPYSEGTGTSTWTIPVARPSEPASTTTAFSHGSSVETS